MQAWSERRPRILVAEDDPEFVELVTSTLEADGYDVFSVGDGGRLMTELARSSRHNYDAVDLVIADLRMPLCSGLQALEVIRLVRPRVRFILMTAFPDNDVIRRVAKANAKLLAKPFSLAALRAAVAESVLFG